MNMQNPPTATRRAETKNIYLVSRIPALSAQNQDPVTISSLNALLQERRLTDCLEWLETIGLTGESALLLLSWLGGEP